MTAEEFQDQLHAASDQLVDAIKPLLAGKHPSLQGIVLADLLAIWVAGHDPAISEALLMAHLKGVRQLIPLYRKQQRPPDRKN